MKIVAGLGNPDEKYNKTRHNAGFIIIDKIADSLDLHWTKSKKFNAEVCRHEDTIFIKPMTYMNNSGRAIEAIMSYYGLLPKKMGLFKKNNSELDNLIVVHDDLDIELGKYKKSIGSRSAGHNGVESIIKHLKTKNFERIRVGIKTSLLDKVPGVKFVLQRFNKEEIEVINNISKEIENELL